MDQKSKRKIVEGIYCDVCRTYAWEFARMAPLFLATGPHAGWHHPSCVIVSPGAGRGRGKR
jgi:hypothetical protein